MRLRLVMALARLLGVDVWTAEEVKSATWSAFVLGRRSRGVPPVVVDPRVVVVGEA